MVGYVARGDQSLASPAKPRAESGERGARTAERGPRTGPPRSDVGTIVLHWATALALIVCLLTGLRVGTFGWVSPRLDMWLSRILPKGDLWTWPFFPGLGLFFCSSAYLIYIYRGGLTRRNALKKL